ncbi:MAG TPA: thioredoxin [Burkholderiaceae bacterium]|nr:thioredoxin [Burkholderiaceae bacterium]
MSTDTTLQTFQADVIDASMQVPVLVDFWAPWCGPCKTLGPMLEKLEQAYGGRFKLVKVDTDAEQQLAQHFRIRSIPTVFAFVGGQPVDQFQGALPEGRLREFIDRLMPNPSDVELDQAGAALERGDAAAATEHAKKAIALDPSNDSARLLYAQLLLADGDAAAAQGQIDALSADAKADPQVQELARRIAQAAEAARAPVPRERIARVEADPADLGARLELAEYWIEHKEWASALEQLLEIVQRDRTFREDVGRRRMVEVFDLASTQPQLVSEWRRRLGAALNVR